MKERLLSDMPDSLLEAIPFSGNENNIDWEEEGKEFSFKGEMYDVAKIKTVNGQKILYCSSDKKEDLLLKQLNDITGSNNQNAGKNGKSLNVKLVYDYVVMGQPDYFIGYPHTRPAYIHYDVALSQQTSPIIAPPPRL